MKFTPHIIGAAALVTLGGAVSGAYIGTSPVLEREARDSLPEAPIIMASNPSAGSSERPPDHYPLVTPERTVPVAELALRGRLRDSAHAHWMRGDDGEGTQLAAYNDIEYSDDDLYRLAREKALIAYTASEPQLQDASGDIAYSDSHAAGQSPSAGSAPLAPPEQVAASPVTASRKVGNAKVVDVAAALASQGK